MSIPLGILTEHFRRENLSGLQFFVMNEPLGEVIRILDVTSCVDAIFCTSIFII